VLEVAGQPNAWRVWVDGNPVSEPIYLPRSHGAWRGIATAESWTTSKRVACNAFGYRFDDIGVADEAGGAWRTLSNALPIRTGVNRLLRTTAASFEALSGSLRLVTPVQLKPKPKHRRPGYVAGTIQRSLSDARR
jgi:hypothetical protein